MVAELQKRVQNKPYEKKLQIIVGDVLKVLPFVQEFSLFPFDLSSLSFPSIFFFFFFFFGPTNSQLSTG